MSRVVSACVSSGGTGVEAIAAPIASRRGDVETQRPGVGQVDAVVDQIPVGPEVVGHAAGTLVDAEAVELAEFDERPPAVDHAAGRIGFVEQAVEEIVPLLLERQSALEFVEDGEPRRQAGLDREVEQHPAGERVQGADRRMIESVERRARPRGSDRVRGCGGCGCATRRRPSR